MTHNAPIILQEDPRVQDIPRVDLIEGERLTTSFFLSSVQAQMMDVDSARRMQEHSLGIRPVKLPYEEMLEMFERVGDGWHLRDEHKNGRRAGSKKLLESKSKTFSWEFMSDDKPIGFCVAVKGGFGPTLETMVNRFNEAADDDTPVVKVASGMEIYKVALYRDFTKQQFGRSLFPMIHDQIFKGQDAVTDHRGQDISKLKGSDFIFLTTTIGPRYEDGTFEGNLVDTRPHYRRLGYTRVGQDRYSVQMPFSTSATAAQGAGTSVSPVMFSRRRSTLLSKSSPPNEPQAKLG